MSELIIDSVKCTLCGKCVRACPFDALRIEGGILKAGAGCVLCGACVKICPELALHIEEGGGCGPASEPDSWRGVWVVAEVNAAHDAGCVAPVSYELAGEGRRLADLLQTDLSAVVMGSGLEEAVCSLSRCRLNRIYSIDSPDLTDFRSGAYAEVLAELVREGRPEILLCGATSNGRAFFPRAAALLGTGLTADCTGLEIDRRRRVLLQTRPAFGGNIMATIECPDRRPQMATVRPNVMPAPPLCDGRDTEVVHRQPSPGSLESPVRVLRRIMEPAGSGGISGADIIVAGGRGCGGAEGFEKLAALARALGGKVAASRAAVDCGWAPYSIQVGQTGRVVQPGLYIACGISGAVQHIVGMRSSGTIVAINSDPAAPIFEAADFGFVGDLHVLVPELTGMVEESG